MGKLRLPHAHLAAREHTPGVLPGDGPHVIRHDGHASWGAGPRAADSLGALRHVPRPIARPMRISWERWHAHRAVLVQDAVAAHPALDVEGPPPSAPEVNPEAGGHGHVTPHLRHAAPVHTHARRPQVDRGVARLRHRPDLLLGCFRQAGLHVN